MVAYSSVNDVGRVINPMIVRGQLDGGVVQGLGQALCHQTWCPIVGDGTHYFAQVVVSATLLLRAHHIDDEWFGE